MGNFCSQSVIWVKNGPYYTLATATTTTVAESNLGKGGRGFWKTSEPPQF